MALLPVLSLCTGGGGLERGVELVLGPLRPVLYVEREAFAAAYLAAEMEASRLAPAPVWSDLSELPGQVLSRLRWVARRHGLFVTAGFPCQPHSVAGERRHAEDDRWLWPDIARILGEVGPSLVFLENVPDVASGGLDQVVGSLAEGGFTAEWDCFSASETGAPHGRERLFVLASDAFGLELLADADRFRGGLQPGRRDGSSRSEAADLDDVGGDLADAARCRCGSGVPGGVGSGVVPEQDGAAVADADRDGHTKPGGAPGPRCLSGGGCEVLAEPDSGRRGKGLLGRRAEHGGRAEPGQSRQDLADAAGRGRREERAGRRGKQRGPGTFFGGDLPFWPPDREDFDAWGAIVDRYPLLAPALDGADVESALRALAHGMALDGPSRPGRPDWIRLAGNGVVPEQAAIAFRKLASRLLEDRDETAPPEGADCDGRV